MIDLSRTTLPLIDLHRHLDGNIRIQTIIDLANVHRVDLPFATSPELSKFVYIQDSTSDLLAFLEKLDLGVSVLGDLDACRRIAYENVEDAINEGLHHLELRFSPYYMAKAFNLPVDGVVEAVAEGVQRANYDFDYNATLIGILSRTFGVERCMQELDALLCYRKELRAIDLAGDEKGFPAALFRPHFDKVKAEGLGVTIHAGEASGAQSIWDAIELLHADRIGHGVRAYEDKTLLEYLSQNNIGLETCLLSNYQTGTWLDLPTHPVKDFIRHNIPVCLNTDDPGVSNNTLKSEYTLAKKQLMLTDAEIAILKNNALEQAFLSQHEKDAVKRRLL